MPTPPLLPHWVLLLQGGDMLIQGLFHHHPDGGLMFLHRAGVRVRKYSLKSGAGGHPISHLLLQPSCELATRSKLWNPTLRVKGRDIITRDRCDYDLSTAAAAREACGLEPESGLRGSNNPTVFEVRCGCCAPRVNALCWGPAASGGRLACLELLGEQNVARATTAAADGGSGGGVPLAPAAWELGQ